MFEVKNIPVVLLFLINIQYTFSQSETVVINQHNFTIKTISIDDTEQIEFIELYRGDKKILTHTLSGFDGDCSSSNIELGNYVIEKSSIIFYSYWASGDRMGSNIYPYGFRKQKYNVDHNGLISIDISELYVESYTTEWEKSPAIGILYKSPKTKKELKLVDTYIREVEKMYQSKFVTKEVKATLEEEVRFQLRAEIKENTEYWSEIYGQNCKM